MKLATTTEDFNRFCKTYKERIKAIYDAGFRYVDISFYSVEESEELLGDNREENARDIKAYADSLGMKLIQAHAPGVNPYSGDEINEDAVADIIHSIEACGILGIPSTVCHVAYNDNWDKKKFMEKNMEFYARLFPIMEKTGVNVLCENSTRVNIGKGYYTLSGKQLKELVEYINHPLFHICWDTGHGNCEGLQYDEIMDMGSDLYALHINDNTGTSDLHTIPFLGTVNMDDVMNGLIDSGFGGYFTFECGNVLRPSNYWLGDRRKFERDTRLLEPTFEMQKEIERFMYNVGVHILKSYDCFEE